MPLKITRLDIEFRYKKEASGFSTLFSYLPIGLDDLGCEKGLPQYRGKQRLQFEAIPEPLQTKLARLTDHVAETLLKLIPDVEIDGRMIPAPRPTVNSYNVRRGPVISVDYATLPEAGSASGIEFGADVLTDAAKRLIENILPTYEQLAWDDLRRRLNLPAVRDTRKKVLISYRRTQPEYRKFAQATAERLGREGFLPWFDEWDVRAGDSLPREIGEGFKDVYGVIIVMTADYPGGKWAREELETAITKRIEQGIKVIPLKYERCEPPELLRPLVYVDCTDHREDQIELQFREIIDALNEIELNPYRR